MRIQSKIHTRRINSRNGAAAKIPPDNARSRQVSRTGNEDAIFPRPQNFERFGDMRQIRRHIGIAVAQNLRLRTFPGTQQGVCEIGFRQVKNARSRVAACQCVRDFRRCVAGAVLGDTNSGFGKTVPAKPFFQREEAGFEAPCFVERGDNDFKRKHGTET